MGKIDFMQNADNVYSTIKYIVSQKYKKCLTFNDKPFITGIDTYYKRTPLRDKQYARLYGKNPIVRGGRVYCSVTKRFYKD